MFNAILACNDLIDGFDNNAADNGAWHCIATMHMTAVEAPTRLSLADTVLTGILAIATRMSRTAEVLPHAGPASLMQSAGSLTVLKAAFYKLESGLVFHLSRYWASHTL